MSVDPTKEQLAALKNYPKDKPLSIVNIVRFRDKTPDGQEEGKEAYKRYIVKSMPFVQAVGGQLIWRGKPTTVIVGDDSRKPDVIFIVQYPSVDSFFQMIKNPEYQAITKDRTIALEIGDLIACEV